MNPSKVGSVSEAKCLAKFLSLGWDVSVPFGHGHPYDLIVDRGSGKGFEKVQVKTARWNERKRVWIIPVSRSVDKVRSNKDGYVNEVDLIAAYCKNSEKVFLFPVKNISAIYSLQLRMDKPKNNQDVKINYAKNFEI